jgi:hypothetical protein
MANKVTGSFTGTGTSAAVSFGRSDVAVWGTFVGTVELQAYYAGEWQTVATYTAPIMEAVEAGQPREYRLECTAFTSGTINYALGV